MAKKKRRKCDITATAKDAREKIPSDRLSVIKCKPSKSIFEEPFHLRTSTVRLILLVFSVFIYANSLRCGFVYDDRRAILENRNVAQAGDWLQLLRDDFWGTPVSHSGSHKSYRPLVTLTYKLQFELENLVRQSLSKFKSLSFSSKEESDIRHTLQDAKGTNSPLTTGDGSDNGSMDNKPENQKANGHAQWRAADAAESIGNVVEPNAFAYHFVNLLLHLCVVDLVFELYGTLLLLLSYKHQRQRNRAITTSETCEQKTVCSKPEAAAAESAHLTRNRKQQRAVTATASTDVRAQISTTTENNCDEESISNSQATTLKCIAGAFLFASHPIHVESVTSLVGRAELMAALFGLMSFRSMLKRLQCAGDDGNADINRRHLFWSICFALLACLSKENGLAVIVINATFALWFVHRNRPLGSRLIWRALGAMLTATCAFACIRLAVLCRGDNTMGSYLPKFSHTDNPLTLSASEFCITHQNLIQTVIGIHPNCSDPSVLRRVRRQMLLTRIYLPAFNLKLLLWPSELSYDWPLSSIGLVGSALETRFLFAVGIYTLLVCYLSPFMLRLCSTAVTELRSALVSLGCSKGCGRRIGSKQPIMSDGAADESSLAERDTRTPDSGYCDSVNGEPQPKGVISDISGDITVKKTTNEDDAGSCCSGDETNSVSSMDTSKSSSDSGCTDCSSTQVDQNAGLPHDEQTAKTGSEAQEVRLPSSSLSSYCYRRKILSRLDNLPERNRTATTNDDQQISNKDYCSVPVKRRSSSRRTSSGLSQVTSPSATIDSTLRSTKSGSGGDNDVDVICWSLIWLILPYMPASNMLVSVGFLAAERILYLPSFGLCLLAAHLIDAMLTRTARAILHPDDPNNGYIHNGTIFFRRRITCQQRQRVAADRPQRREGKSDVLSDTNISNINKKTSESEYGSEQSLPVDRKCAIKLALIMPLILLGALRTIQRNGDWLNESTLYNSNVLQSPAKSMANLATIGHLQHYSDPSEYSVIELYRRALDLEPHSADLHYNLALELHQQLDRSGSAITSTEADDVTNIKVTADGSGRQRQYGGDPIEYHYKTAIRLRANFPMAALSLGAYQWLHLGRLAEAEQTFVSDCANRMDPSRSKTYQWFVQTQIECLISAAKLHATATDTIQSDGYPDRRGERKTNIDAAAEQTNSNNNNNINKQDASADQSAEYACPLRVIEWMQSARRKAHRIDAAGQSQPHSFGDLNKQLASINWLEVRCSLKQSVRAVAPSAVDDEQTKQQRHQRCLGLLAEAVERYAWSSRSPIESAIYIDYAKALIEAAPTKVSEAEKVLRHSFDVELAKVVHSNSGPSGRQVEHLMALVRYLWKRFSPGAAADKAEQLVRLLSDSELMFDRLTLAAEIALDMGDSRKSESHYERALEELQVKVNEKVQMNEKLSRAQSKRLARAHVNYGAILQINGKLAKAHDEFVQAIEWDQSNTIAKRNLASIQRKV